MKEVMFYAVLCALFYVVYMLIGLIEKQSRQFGRWLVKHFWRTD